MLLNNKQIKSELNNKMLMLLIKKDINGELIAFKYFLARWFDVT